MSNTYRYRVIVIYPNDVAKVSYCWASSAKDALAHVDYLAKHSYGRAVETEFASSEDRQQYDLDADGRAY